MQTADMTLQWEIICYWTKTNLRKWKPENWKCWSIASFCTTLTGISIWFPNSLSICRFSIGDTTVLLEALNLTSPAREREMPLSEKCPSARWIDCPDDLTFPTRFYRSMGNAILCFDPFSSAFCIAVVKLQQLWSCRHSCRTQHQKSLRLLATLCRLYQRFFQCWNARTIDLA